MRKILLSLFSATSMMAFAQFAQKDIAVELNYPFNGHQFTTTDTNDFFFTVTNTGTTALTSEDTVYFNLTIDNFFIPLYNGAIPNLLLPINRGADDNNPALQATLEPDSSIFVGFRIDYFFPQQFIDSFTTHQACVNALVWDVNSEAWYTDSDETDNIGCNSGIPLGTEEVVNNTFSTYPNPVVNELFLNIEADDATFKIYSLEGKAITSSAVVKGENAIDVSELSKGTYFYIIRKDGNNIGSGKFLK